MIGQLKVHEAFRRRGIATSMWRRAQVERPDARHSILISEDGMDWAQSLGEDLLQAMPAAVACGI